METTPNGEPERGTEAGRAGIAPGILFLVAVALFAPRLAVPAQYVFDEVYHAYTAGQYVAGNADAYVWYTTAPVPGVAYMWNHPPLGLLFIAGGILLWGDDAFGWRFSSVMFGAAGIALAFLLALRLTGSKRTAWLAALLLLLDGMYFAQSRIGMLDIFGVVFAIGALISLYGYLQEPAGRATWPLVRTGILLGADLATKWNAAYLCAACGLLVLIRGIRLGLASRRHPGDAGLRAGWHAHAIGVPVGFGVVPLAVYLAAYVPFFATGHSLGQWIELQKQIYLYHTRLEATHPWSSRWWQWPLALKPVWYWVADMARGRVANVYAAPNPILYWGFLPAVPWVAFRWWSKNRSAFTVLVIGFFAQWLPWALVPRIAFAYHFLPAVPFGALALAVALTAMFRKGGAWRVAAVAYAALVVAAFVFYYPILVGLPLTPHALDLRLWLPEWRPH